MKLQSWVLLFLFGLAASTSAQARWMTDYSSALKQAQAEDKAVLINFTGSDWCGWCIRLKEEVFSTAEFKDFANESLVLLEVDFPRKISLSSDQVAKNEKMAKDFGVRGYPTVYLVDKNGKKLVKTGYGEGGPVPYIAGLKKALPSSGKGVESASAPVAAPATAGGKKETPAYAVPAPVIRYDKIALKGIFGGKSKTALINNQSLGAGEKGKIKVEDKIVEVLVKEIRENSVLVQVEGETEPRELTLK